MKCVQNYTSPNPESRQMNPTSAPFLIYVKILQVISSDFQTSALYARLIPHPPAK
jgi:hypothetical protein